jgi:hypothetical protein
MTANMATQWRRAFFRLWIAFTTLWIIIGQLVFWLAKKGWKLCDYSQQTMPKVPPFECTQPAGLSEHDIAANLAIFGLPLFVLLSGCLIGWALQGFRARSQ